MNLIPSTTELSPAPAPKGAASKGAASCPGLHQVAKIFKDWDTTTPGTLSYVWPISIPCLLSFHCTPLTWAQPFLLHNPHQEEGESDTPSRLFQEPHFLTSHTKSLSSPAVSATLPGWILQTQDMTLQTPSRQHRAENNRPSLPVSCAVAHAA